MVKGNKDKVKRRLEREQEELRQQEEQKAKQKEERQRIVRENPLSEEAQKILDYWNSKGIVKHKPYNQELVRNLSRCLKRYDINEVIESIDNYATVYFDIEYKPYPSYERYKFTLSGFLAFDKQVCEFMADGQKWIRYCEHKAKQKPVEEKPIPIIAKVETEQLQEDLYQQCIQFLRSMDYKEYIKTDHWQHFRKEALKHFQITCQLCGAKDMTIDIHHKIYINRGRETFNDVIALCRHCHDMYHHNKDQCTCPRCSGEEGEHMMQGVANE